MTDRAAVRPYAAVDLDGTVADVRHRLHHVRDKPKDWPAFFAAARADPLLPEGAAVARRLAEDHELVWLTGRPDHCRADTEEWLARHDLPVGEVLMRPAGDRRPARVVKLAHLRRLAARRPVAVLVDDDTEVLSAARAAGFTVFEATWGTEPADAAVLRAAQERDGRS